MKKSELIFSFLLVPLDFLMIILAGVSAYYLRFTALATEIRPAIFNLPFGEYFKILSLIAIAWLIIFALAGLYNIKGPRHLGEEIYLIILACSTGLMLIVVLIFVFRELFSSRFIVLAGWLIAIAYIAAARIIIRSVQRILLRFGIGVHKIVLVGSSSTADILIHEFSSRKNLGYEIVKRLKNFSLESEQEMSMYLKTGQADEIMQSDPNLSKAEALRLFDFADVNHLTFKYAADLLGAKVLKTEVEKFKGEISGGKSLSSSFKSSKLFPELVINIIAIGEETGSLDKSLMGVACDYEGEVSRALKEITRLLEPVVILVMGLIVGFIVLSMLLPIFQINLIMR